MAFCKLDLDPKIQQFPTQNKTKPRPSDRNWKKIHNKFTTYIGEIGHGETQRMKPDSTNRTKDDDPKSKAHRNWRKRTLNIFEKKKNLPIDLLAKKNLPIDLQQ